MTLKIEIDASDVLDTVENMLHQIEIFPKECMTQEFLNWQAEDMRRKEPDVTQEDKDVYTILTPRSQVHNRPQRQRMTPGTAIRKPRRPVIRQQQVIVSTKPRSTRPILREELFDRLDERMVRLMHEELAWQ
jgi:hypothetical protein